MSGIKNSFEVLQQEVIASLQQKSLLKLDIKNLEMILKYAKMASSIKEKFEN